MKASKTFLLRAVVSIIIALAAFSCSEIGVFEKNVTVPGHKWEGSFKPSIRLQITDSATPYNIYVVVRHTDAYPYNNLWLKLHHQVNDSVVAPNPINLTLGNNEQGWLGSGMDDIFEQRVRITPVGGIPLASGTHEFVLEHIMRKDPLPEVMNIGIRVEKVQ